ncbi:hypothetical protein LOK49_LG04G02168 [Camellia lanceoleosa]|uniref:Uncharacterized protein n=1 Tax=Camellia lanceoleosa TaxID=1840588 RepID=A0ACC0HXF1_9ERIC|nr:hypothetical protein LOK49_LG04G02168 [Camellia lanceoleosa]
MGEAQRVEVAVAHKRTAMASIDVWMKNASGKAPNAVTDGSMNIVPHAYRSTGKLFPAQALLMSGTSNEITSFHEYAYRYSASSSFSGSQSVPLQKESEHIDISSYNASLVLGDYIPLSSPKHLDAKENGNAFSKAGVLEDNQIEYASCGGYIDLSSPEECIFPMPFGLMDSNQPSFVFSPGRDHCDEKYRRVKGLYILILKTNEDASQVKEDPMDTWNGKQIGKCIPLLNVNEEGKMLKIECETEGRNRVDGEEQQKRRLVRLMPRNKPNAKTDDNQTSLSQNDIKPALIYPTNSDGDGEEQWKGLTNMDSMLRKQDGPGKNCFGEVGTKPLKATRKTRKCETEGRNRVDGEEQQKKRRLVRLMLRNKSDAKIDDNQTRPSQNDIKSTLIYLTITDGNGEEQWKGLTNIDSMLRSKKELLQRGGHKAIECIPTSLSVCISWGCGHEMIFVLLLEIAQRSSLEQEGQKR